MPVIADVSGKSIPASLFMMRAKTAIKDYARGGQDPARLLEGVLRDIRDYAGTAEQFDDLTMLCLEYKGKKE